MKNNNGHENNIIKEMQKKLENKTMDEAKELYPSYVFRAVMINGVPQIVTKDLRRDRVNVWLNNELISVVSHIG